LHRDHRAGQSFSSDTRACCSTNLASWPDAGAICSLDPQLQKDTERHEFVRMPTNDPWQNRNMLLPAPLGSQRAQGLAAQLGCTVGEFASSDGQPEAALLGSVASLADMLLEFGARFDPGEKVYVFRNWPTLEAALRHIVNSRKSS